MTGRAPRVCFLATASGDDPGSSPPATRCRRRSPSLHRLVGDGTLPAGYATDDGAGLLYRGTTMVEALTERDGALAYRVEAGPSGTAVETPLDVTRL